MENQTARFLKFGPQSLEKENFRVNSVGWKEKTLPENFPACQTRVKINPEGDIIELIEGESKGEQFFTFDAALRETMKVGKRIPSKEEWIEIFHSINPSVSSELSWQNDISIRETLWLKLVGYYHPSSSSDGYYYHGSFASYWSSSSDETHGHLVHFSLMRLIPMGLDNKLVGLSVRCLAI